MPSLHGRWPLTVPAERSSSSRGVWGQGDGEASWSERRRSWGVMLADRMGLGKTAVIDWLIVQVYAESNKEREVFQ